MFRTGPWMPGDQNPTTRQTIVKAEKNLQLSSSPSEANASMEAINIPYPPKAGDDSQRQPAGQTACHHIVRGESPWLFFQCGTGAGGSIRTSLKAAVDPKTLAIQMLARKKFQDNLSSKRQAEGLPWMSEIGRFWKLQTDGNWSVPSLGRRSTRGKAEPGVVVFLGSSNDVCRCSDRTCLST